MVFNMINVFGKVRMGYLVVASQKFKEWETFGVEGIGLHLDKPSADVLSFRMDAHASRLIVRRGKEENVVASGWQVEDEQTLAEIVKRLKADGVQIRVGSDKEAQIRGVESFTCFTGPKRMEIELFTSPQKTNAALKMKSSGFVTGGIGMGHVVFSTKEPQAMLAFWKKYFDARTTDKIEAKINGLNLDIEFMRLNPRHHSVAVAATRGLRLDPFRTRIQHVNLEVASLDDMTNAYVRCRKLGFKVAMGVGLHTNDKDLSFYVVTPSDFQVEVGWNPIQVENEANWQPKVYQAISLWGHQPKDQTLGDKLHEMRCAVGSLFRTEYTVPQKHTASN
jgi:2,3-dihydroxybiphenyl 1,2-dioxygenase